MGFWSWEPTLSHLLKILDKYVSLGIDINLRKVVKDSGEGFRGRNTVI